MGASQSPEPEQAVSLGMQAHQNSACNVVGVACGDVMLVHRGVALATDMITLQSCTSQHQMHPNFNSFLLPSAPIRPLLELTTTD